MACLYALWDGMDGIGMGWDGMDEGMGWDRRGGNGMGWHGCDGMEREWNVVWDEMERKGIVG